MLGRLNAVAGWVCGTYAVGPSLEQRECGPRTTYLEIEPGELSDILGVTLDHGLGVVLDDARQVRVNLVSGERECELSSLC